MAGLLIRTLAWLSVAASIATVALPCEAAASKSAASKGMTVPQLQVWTRNTIRYSCDHRAALTVHYVNTKNEQSFALLDVKGRSMLFVNVSAASGSKYVAGQYTWWTKGPEGDLRDEMADSNAAPILGNCMARR